MIAVAAVNIKIMLREAINNPRFPHVITITRRTYTDDPFSDTYQDEVLYHGKGRSYTDTTTTGDAQVIANRRKISIPVRFDAWEGPVMAGDLVDIQMGAIHEYGLVTDFEPDNNRSVIYWDYTRD